MQLLTPATLLDCTPNTPDWIWHGLIAKGHVTLLTSLWKSGKSTLIGHLLAARKADSIFLGQAIKRGTTAIVSEEAPLNWGQRSRLLIFGERSCVFFCRPFAGVATLEGWDVLSKQLLQIRDEHGLDLVVIDSLTHFLATTNENLATQVLQGMAPILGLARQGLGMLISHHPARGRRREGVVARGSRAIPGCADILMEMSLLGRSGYDDRRRRIQAYSRFEETPRRMFTEVSPDGKQYTRLPDLGPGEFAAKWGSLRNILEAAAGPLTRREVLDRLPANERPSSASLWRWLEFA
ncbi:MAG: AAA family ATPase, partial [Planctomycetes bacterium]|nr:AAA family ATPase [Planctomycetota bacterium]